LEWARVSFLSCNYSFSWCILLLAGMPHHQKLRWFMGVVFRVRQTEFSGLFISTHLSLWYRLFTHIISQNLGVRHEEILLALRLFFSHTNRMKAYKDAIQSSRGPTLPTLGTFKHIDGLSPASNDVFMQFFS
jgi:hypothetical protein